jgi:hypothetical protein
MPKRYPREFRRALCERLVAGERISRVSSETGFSENRSSAIERRASRGFRWAQPLRSQRASSRRSSPRPWT